MAVKVRRGERMADAVPELAVMGNGAAHFVFIVSAKGMTRQIAVTTGLRDGGLIEVSGIPPGSRVVGDGVLKVTDKMKVRVAEAGPQSGPVPKRGT